MNKSALQRLEELHEAAYTKLNQTGSSYYEGKLTAYDIAMQVVEKAGWQPIDTIPSGGGMPITVLVLTSINSVYTAYSMGGEIALITPFDGLSSDYKAHGEPRYWMPLPAAPKYDGGSYD